MNAWSYTSSGSVPDFDITVVGVHLSSLVLVHFLIVVSREEKHIYIYIHKVAICQFVCGEGKKLFLLTPFAQSFRGSFHLLNYFYKSQARILNRKATFVCERTGNTAERS
jgi:hypothetical protein